MAQRSTDKHSPRVDDQMKHEAEALTHGSGVESHAREDLRAEPPAEGERMPNPAERPNVVSGAGPGMSAEEAEARAELAACLRPAVFPTGRAGLVAAAEEEHAPEEVLTALRALPTTREFATLEDVWVALGGGAEARHT